MLLDKEKVIVVILNMQLELIPLLRNGTQLLNNCRWMADVCCDLGIPVQIVEHKKLGQLSQTLTEVAGEAEYLEKTYFDFTAGRAAEHQIKESGREHYVLAGAETHVCILQSALGLCESGKEVFLLADACSARAEIDHEIALQRIQQSGGQLITRDMFFFEMIRHSEYPGYIDLAMKYLDGRYIR